MENTKQAILAYLKQHPVSLVHVAQIQKNPELQDVSSVLLRRALKELVRTGQLHKGRGKTYGLPAPKPTFDGRFSLAREGYGFVVVDGQDGRDIFVPESMTATAADGDRVRVQLDFSSHHRRTGRIISILERSRSRVSGFVERKGRRLFVDGTSAKIPARIWLDEDSELRPEVGTQVGVEITQYPGPHDAEYHGVVRVVFADAGEIQGDVRRVIFDLGLPTEFPADVRKIATQLPTAVQPADTKTHVDLTDVPFVTIDGEDAKDFDDAVALVRGVDGTFKAYVAVADVAWYVEADSPLDREARARGTSVYFPTCVLPMLPEELSNGLCSLKPNVERLALVVCFRLDASRDVRDHTLVPAVIRSRQRLTYPQVDKALQGDVDAIADPALREMVIFLNQIAERLFRERLEKGSLDLEIPEAWFRLSADAGEILDVESRKRTPATGLIEEWMLLANKTVAQEFLDRRIPTVHRIHEPPDPVKIESFLRLVRAALPEEQISPSATPFQVQSVLHKTPKRAAALVLQNVLLRSLTRARYSTQSLGHFGLAFDAYLHFTSPIRRYPDLVVHRLIHRYVFKSDAKLQDQSALLKVLNDIAHESSTAERRAQDAERTADSVLKARFMMDKVGCRYDGTISGMTAGGVFVTLGNWPIDGYLPIEQLSLDDWQFDPLRMEMRAWRTRAVLRLGDRLEVVVARVDTALRQIELARVATPQKDKPQMNRGRQISEQRAVGDRIGLDKASGSKRSGTNQRSRNKSPKKPRKNRR
ncbi:MAG: ribonuclease R [Myxococcales bacterium]|nr:ribonuclease R [Myxococcales bacterium]